MRKAIELAEKGLGSVSPNPLVGAVLVHNGRIIGEGFHQEFGGPHAEVNCINNVKKEDKHLIAESTMHVTLEPCSHHGKTPPCCDLIIAQQIKNVVIGSKDPFVAINGRGIEQLRKAEVEVVMSDLERECRFLNRRFLTFVEKKRPYIILKWAESKDGFIAPKGNTSYWLSSDESKVLSHKWRTEEVAILVGYNTALKDNPRLTVRLHNGKNPTRIVIDKSNTLPKFLNLFDNSVPTLVFNEISNETIGLTQFVKVDFKHSFFAQFFEVLVSKSIQSVIIEGGTKTHQLFMESNFWDEARVIKTSVEFGDGLSAPNINCESNSTCYYNGDKLELFYNSQS
jgi:diaminohydroxyphosphoribosylaminopyrimidine deaminase/5-amino-6-(5-phosphoribosylamino)uracil reductase